jgi:hypothetical protein
LQLAWLLRVGPITDDQVSDLIEFDVRSLRARCAPRASKRGFARSRRAAEEDDDPLTLLHVTTVDQNDDRIPRLRRRLVWRSFATRVLVGSASVRVTRPNTARARS